MMDIKTDVNMNAKAKKLAEEMSKKGIRLEPVYVNGQMMGLCGTTGAEDRARAMEALNTAAQEARNSSELYSLLMQMAKIQEDKKKNEVKVIVKKKTYTLDLDEGTACNCCGTCVCKIQSPTMMKVLSKDNIREVLIGMLKDL